MERPCYPLPAPVWPYFGLETHWIHWILSTALGLGKVESQLSKHIPPIVFSHFKISKIRPKTLSGWNPLCYKSDMTETKLPFRLLSGCQGEMDLNVEKAWSHSQSILISGWGAGVSTLDHLQAKENWEGRSLLGTALGIYSTLGCAQDYLGGTKLKPTEFLDSLRIDPSFLKSGTSSRVGNYAGLG